MKKFLFLLLPLFFVNCAGHFAQHKLTPPEISSEKPIQEILVASLGDGFLLAMTQSDPDVGTGATESGSCTLSDLYNENTSDYGGSAGSAANDYQYVNNAASRSFCKVAMELYRTSSDVTVHLELWSDAAKSGTQYGSDSGQVVVSATALGTLYDFTFGSNPDPPGNFYTHVIVDSGSYAFLRYGTVLGDPDTGLGDTNYDFYKDGVEQTHDAKLMFYE